MTGHRPVLRRSGCLIPLAVLASIPLSFIALIWWAIRDDPFYNQRTYYGHEILASLPSPTGNWTVVISEDIADHLDWVEITDGVVLVSNVNSIEPIDLLWVGTNGDKVNRPRITWSGKNVLSVTVPYKSNLDVLTQHVDRVDVDIRFDPDDPAARAVWLKQIREAKFK
jgi:hypothetical protein